MQEKTTHKHINTRKLWFTLDNAAKIFPAVMNRKLTTVFRISAVLKKPVVISALMRAVTHAEKRFPYYLVQLKEGFFWYYLEHIPAHIPVEPDNQRPCRIFPRNGLLLRVLVKDRQISLECSHILTDGGGALSFLKFLLKYYSEELEKPQREASLEKYPDYNIPEEEYEDSYKRYFRENIPPMVSRSRAYHLPFTLSHKSRFCIRRYHVSLQDIKAAASEKHVTITDYLVAVYMCALQEVAENQELRQKNSLNRRIRVQVPVNLRNIFPSVSMRNFSLFVMPEIDLRLGHYSFDEILKAVYHQIRLETDEKLINKNISRNVGSEKKIYVKSIPLFLKSLILRINYYTKGTNQYSGVVTNLGKVKLEEDTMPLVDHFIFSPPPPNKILKVGCGIVGYDDKLVISFGNITRTDLFERTFTAILQKKGITVEAEQTRKEKP